MLFFSVVTLSACGPAWESTRDITRSTYRGTRDIINPEPKIDVNKYKWDNPNQEKLALLFSPVDAKVSALMRYVGDQDMRPTPEWMETLFLRFPWIDGVLVADTNGDILERRPAVPVKRFSEPLVFESIWRETLVKTVVDYTELGPELYFGSPFYEGVEFKGLTVVSFDPRILFSFCPDPEQLIIVDPRGKKIWTADPANATQHAALLAEPWEEVLKKKTHGTVRSSDGSYTWLVRYIGPDLFVYATKSAQPDFEDRGISIMPFFGLTRD